MEVQPPPMSITVAPICFSSSVKRRQARGISREQRAHHIEVAALDRQLEILQRAGFDRHRMHGDADALAEHAGGIAHAPRLVHHIGGRRALDDLMAVQAAAGTPVAQQHAQMVVRHQGAVQRHHRPAVDRDGLAAIDRNQHILEASRRHGSRPRRRSRGWIPPPVPGWSPCRRECRRFRARRCPGFSSVPCSARPMTQATLEEPISSADTSPGR